MTLSMEDDGIIEKNSFCGKIYEVFIAHSWLYD